MKYNNKNDTLLFTNTNDIIQSKERRIMMEKIEKNKLELFQKELKQLRKQNQEITQQLLSLETDPNIIAYKKLLHQNSSITNQITNLTNHTIPLQKAKCCNHILVLHYKQDGPIKYSTIVCTCVKCGLTSKYLENPKNALELEINHIWKELEDREIIKEKLFSETPMPFQDYRIAYDQACQNIDCENREEITEAMRKILRKKTYQKRKK